MGPQMLRPNGTVFATGASGYNAVYNTATGKWSSAPKFPVIGGKQYDVADGPGAVLPDGNVLVDASPGVNKKPTHSFVFNGTTLSQVADAPNASISSSYYGSMVMLPTGQVLFNDGLGKFYVYNAGGSPETGWRPDVTSVPTAVTAGDTYTVSGNQLGGLTQDAAYGDDYQSATNFPLVRITNAATGDVTYRSYIAHVVDVRGSWHAVHCKLHTSSRYRDRRQHARRGRQRNRFVVDSNHRQPVRDQGGIPGYKGPVPSSALGAKAALCPGVVASTVARVCDLILQYVRGFFAQYRDPR